MADSELKRFIPADGDRMAVRIWLARQSVEEPTEVDSDAKHNSDVIKRLKEKISGIRSGRLDSRKRVRPSTFHTDVKQNASKPDRRIELGWIHFDATDKTFRQVKSNRGGGTRHLRVPKETTVESILDSAKELFFPKGVSSKGMLEEFTCDIRNFCHNPVTDTCTVAELYNITKLRMLRLYLATRAADQVQYHLLSC